MDWHDDPDELLAQAWAMLMGMALVLMAAGGLLAAVLYVGWRLWQGWAR